MSKGWVQSDTNLRQQTGCDQRASSNCGLLLALLLRLRGLPGYVIQRCMILYYTMLYCSVGFCYVMLCHVML